jgi:hypothetical protein
MRYADKRLTAGEARGERVPMPTGGRRADVAGAVAQPIRVCRWPLSVIHSPTAAAHSPADRRDSWRVVELSLVRAELVIRYLVVWRRAQGDPVS